MSLLDIKLNAKESKKPNIIKSASKTSNSGELNQLKWKVSSCMNNMKLKNGKRRLSLESTAEKNTQIRKPGGVKSP